MVISSTMPHGCRIRKGIAVTSDSAVRDGYSRGWSFTPLNGKAPIQESWQTAKRAELNDVLRWAWEGNVGLRCGSASGVVVIDIDEGADLTGWFFPPTVTVKTGGGGIHLYYKAPDYEVGNSRKRWGLPNKIDIRGEGGQVVFVGSVHPDSGKPYEYVPDMEPWNIGLAEFPLHERHVSKSVDAPAPEAKSSSRNQSPSVLYSYCSRAMEREAECVASCEDGGRNHQLNESAFKIGTLVGTGVINRQDAERTLVAAAEQCGLEPWEYNKTINSGLNAGINNPRDLSDVGSVHRESSVSPGRHAGADSAVLEKPHVLQPGSYTDPNGNDLEIGNDEFCSQIAHRLPADAAYTHGGIPGEIVGEPGVAEFRPFSSETFRFVVDRHIKIKRWKNVRVPKSEGGGTKPVLVYDACPRSLAAMAIENVARFNTIREIEQMSSFPVYDASWKLCSPGWSGGIYYDQPPELRGIEPIKDVDTIRNTLDDLVVDFPFAEDADKHNFFGLMLTPLLSAAVDGNRPMHLIRASMPRTGKTKLVEEVLGGIVLGYPTPAIQFSSEDAEFDKRIVGILKTGKPIVHLDNLKQKLESAALASLLTAGTYQGRILGTNTEFKAKNALTIVGSGNNVNGSSELIRRIVPINLLPRTDAPELRNDFKHHKLRAFVKDSRRTVLGCLIGMVENWKDAGMPRLPMAIGGFEEWGACVGGIMMLHNFAAWMGNWESWVQLGDPQREDMKLLVVEWWKRFGQGKVSAAEIAELARELQVFPEAFLSQTERGQLISFSKRVLSPHVQARVCGKRIHQAGTGTSSGYYLANESDAEMDVLIAESERSDQSLF